jgi:drug/metabolite transporter (DMT)-like permease
MIACRGAELLWIATTLSAAALQTARNAMQGSLTAKLGTLGATQVRFIFGLPFAVLFLTIVTLVSGDSIPPPSTMFLVFTASGAVAQILGTVFLLAAMRERSFSVATAFTKTEAVQVALFGLMILGDELTWLRMVAIAVATIGIFLIAFKPGEKLTADSLRPALQGIASGGMYAIAAVGFRGGILALDQATPYFLRASTTLVWSLAIQSVLLGAWMQVFQPKALRESVKLWRQSLFAGFTGALASQCWFLGFSLTTAANVRTLGLVEVLFAQAVSRRIFSQTTTMRELSGMALVVVGVGLLLAAAL